MLSVQYSGHVCSFDTITCAAGIVSEGRWILPRFYLAVTNSGIEKAKRDRKDHVKDLIEGIPSDDQSHHCVSGLVDPIQIAVRRILTHNQHNPGVTVERGDRKKIKCSEDQIQNKHNAQSG